MIAELLDQNQTWTTKDGRELTINQIGPYHAHNICTFLDRRATNLQLTYWNELWGFALTLNGEMAQHHAEMELDTIIQKDPKEWLHQTPLYQAIAARATKHTTLLKIRNKAWRLTHSTF